MCYLFLCPIYHQPPKFFRLPFEFPGFDFPILPTHFHITWDLYPKLYVLTAPSLFPSLSKVFIFACIWPSLRMSFLPSQWVPKSSIPFISNFYSLSSSWNPRLGIMSPFLEFTQNFTWTFSCSPFITCKTVLSSVPDCHSLEHQVLLFLFLSQCQTHAFL